jgi:Flp pilus assembly protein TadD
MTLPEQFDDAMLAFSRGDFDAASARLRAVLVVDPANFDAQLALGMSCFRKGDLAAALAEGHLAEKLQPQAQLAHTNLSVFYMKAGDIGRAEFHSFQAKVAGWREDAQKAKALGSKLKT